LKRVLLVAGAVVGALLACGDDETFVPCRDIPAGGCPHTRGASCDDPVCRAIYTCNDQKEWVVEQTCPPLPEDSGVVTEAGTDSATQIADGAISRDANFVVPPGASGGEGCGELEAPDCSLGFALACPANSCCDCEEIYVCNNGGWEVWGSCSAGNLIPD